ncbi:uncharacterized protein Z518_08706 [Rhinocladiella mackenziei CBS 650.93]|uniref:Xylanolytic transcriptional activator regulatory domain-containing protein n=1 Tax=Rhinocladiella mackenziei CBS 650.93 TaxID=1442369 RepID=A0A0D2IA65_9EURO|nr:uncharacterized protein Z518_08706 [Rhinocladiella mackenziei CBS 650.93]KIX02764.1 hypothetical protein Z518_08706 [Rhinocladiella mackenziei CBS 650.93]
MTGTLDFWPTDVNPPGTIEECPVQQQSNSNAVGPTLRQGAAASAPSSMDENSCTSSETTSRNPASGVMDTNLHTSNLEFYGSASSVAFLRHVETLSNYQGASSTVAGPPERELASLIHNTDFQPHTSHSMAVSPREAGPNPDRFHFRVARRFLDAYFSNVHYIQPLLEEEEFLARCEDLWFNRPGKQPLSFIALYYATLSLGSLLTKFETPEISGADRFTWSRNLFNAALAITTRLGTVTDVEMVQCFYMMSKVCQHELNPHVAYLYSGQAARTSLAIGINRSPISPDITDPRASKPASKTWWAVYCLDIQTSFALGRPDSLGPDQYHTQHFPTADPGESTSSPHPDVLQIVPCMVGLSRIMRKVALELYTQPCGMEYKLPQAKTLDDELEHWLEQVPAHLRSEPPSASDPSLLKPRRLASYIKKQSVVLRLRYLNLRMVIHAVFMTDTKTDTQYDIACLQKCQSRCIQSAEDAIDLIYSTFCSSDYFQTWWYNSTYTLFAVSVLLAVVFRQLARTQQALESLFAHIDRAILILQAMDDCSVARNATAIIKRTLARAKKVPQPALGAQQSSSFQDADLHGTLRPPVDANPRPQPEDVDTLFQPQVMDGDDLDWLDVYPFDDSQQALFWTEWAHELDTLGT